MKKRCVAIVLSAGQGKRMGTSIQKQYIELCGKPIICYCLEAFEKSEIIDDVIMVAGAGHPVITPVNQVSVLPLISCNALT